MAKATPQLGSVQINSGRQEHALGAVNFRVISDLLASKTFPIPACYLQLTNFINGSTCLTLFFPRYTHLNPLKTSAVSPESAACAADPPLLQPPSWPSLSGEGHRLLRDSCPRSVSPVGSRHPSVACELTGIQSNLPALMVAPRCPELAAPTALKINHRIPALLTEKGTCQRQHT